MKTFGIYQFFVTKSQEEKQLLIGFSTGESEKEAIDNFTTDEFEKGYLSAIECMSIDTENQGLLDYIEKNKVLIGSFL